MEAAMNPLGRYSRQIVLPEVGVSGQSSICDATIMVIGLGGLGCPAAHYLAAAGVNRLIVVDRDRVERSNLQRQTLYSEADVGRSKIQAAQRRLYAINSQVTVSALDEGTEHPEFESHLAEADIVLDCTDNFKTRFAINAACVKYRKPLISGAAVRLEGQIAVFDLRQPAPCYACTFPPHGENAEACEDSGILGPVVGIIGAMQALMALQLLLGHNDIVGRLHLWNARQLSWRSLGLVKDPTCPVCSPYQ